MSSIIIHQGWNPLIGLVRTGSKSDYYYERLEKIRKKKHKGTARPGTSEYYRR